MTPDRCSQPIHVQAARKSPLAKREQSIEVVQVRRDPLPAAELGDALLASQALEHDPDLLLRGELPAASAADLTHCRLSGLLLLSSHIETLLGASDPAKCLFP
jgi:hypothetical protein